MSDRIVLLLQSEEPEQAAEPGPAPHGRPTVRLMIREPEGHAGIWTFGCQSSDEVFAALTSGGDGAAVAAAGQQLYRELSAKPEVSAVLKAAMQQPDTEKRPVYVDVTGADACQELPWEALRTEDGTFLALDRWPVARMLASTAGAVPKRRLSPPLRIAAVLSCLNVDPRGEWDALRRAVETAGIPVQVMLLLSDFGLHDELAAEQLPWLTINDVPVDYSDLQHTITSFEPHILHFFTHGETAGGPHLQIATAVDVQAGSTVSSHRLEAGGIRNLVRQPKEAPWAVVLNACSSDAGGGESGARSLAAALVRDHGVQAVIGMREPVLSTDAASFAGAFYRSLFADIAACMAVPGRETELDWAANTVDARMELCRDLRELPGAAAARHRQWILPVVTVRPARFKLEIAGPAPSAELDRLFEEFKASVLANLPATTPRGTLVAFGGEPAP